MYSVVWKDFSYKDFLKPYFLEVAVTNMYISQSSTHFGFVKLGVISERGSGSSGNAEMPADELLHLTLTICLLKVLF